MEGRQIVSRRGPGAGRKGGVEVRMPRGRGMSGGKLFWKSVELFICASLKLK